jgi:hypothetical protein
MRTICPRCEGEHVRKPSFTWWGGALGALILCHRICQFCRFSFNGKTGAPNRRAVYLYLLASNAVVALFIAFAELVSAQR